MRSEANIKNKRVSSPESVPVLLKRENKFETHTSQKSFLGEDPLNQSAKRH